MRRAKSYSIVDHQLLHGGYFHQLSHEALVLYLFLVVVGDPEGRSFYADVTLETILRFLPHQLDQARSELIQSGLIDYRSPYWWVNTIPESVDERSQTKNPLSQRRPGALVSSDSKRIGDLAKESLQALFPKLSGDKNETPSSP
jgi:hypothetical protein